MPALYIIDGYLKVFVPLQSVVGHKFDRLSAMFELLVERVNHSTEGGGGTRSIEGGEGTHTSDRGEGTHTSQSENQLRRMIPIVTFFFFFLLPPSFFLYTSFFLLLYSGNEVWESIWNETHLVVFFFNTQSTLNGTHFDWRPR